MREFKVKINAVKKIGKKGDTIAECLPVLNKKFKDTYKIKVSTNQANTMLKFFIALMHEFIHLAFFIVKDVFKYTVEGHSEHKFISLIEDSLSANFYVVKEKKRRKK